LAWAAGFGVPWVQRVGSGYERADVAAAEDVAAVAAVAVVDGGAAVAAVAIGADKRRPELEPAHGPGPERAGASAIVGAGDVDDVVAVVAVDDRGLAGLGKRPVLEFGPAWPTRQHSRSLGQVPYHPRTATDV